MSSSCKVLGTPVPGVYSMYLVLIVLLPWGGSFRKGVGEITQR